MASSISINPKRRVISSVVLKLKLISNYIIVHSRLLRIRIDYWLKTKVLFRQVLLCMMKVDGLREVLWVSSKFQEWNDSVIIEAVYESSRTYFPIRWTDHSFWHNGHLRFCWTHWDIQQWWKEWLHSPHTTTQSGCFPLICLLASPWHLRQASKTDNHKWHD